MQVRRHFATAQVEQLEATRSLHAGHRLDGVRHLQSTSGQLFCPGFSLRRHRHHLLLIKNEPRPAARRVPWRTLAWRTRETSAAAACPKSSCWAGTNPMRRALWRFRCTSRWNERIANDCRFSVRAPESAWLNSYFSLMVSAQRQADRCFPYPLVAPLLLGIRGQ